jgi:hypothetical protein
MGKLRDSEVRKSHDCANESAQHSQMRMALELGASFDVIMLQNMLDQITGKDVTEFAAHRKSSGLQISTANSSLRVLRRVFRMAVEWGAFESLNDTLAIDVALEGGYSSAHLAAVPSQNLE